MLLEGSSNILIVEAAQKHHDSLISEYAGHTTWHAYTYQGAIDLINARQYDIISIGGELLGQRELESGTDPDSGITLESGINVDSCGYDVAYYLTRHLDLLPRVGVRIHALDSKEARSMMWLCHQCVGSISFEPVGKSL